MSFTEATRMVREIANARSGAAFRVSWSWGAARIRVCELPEGLRAKT